MVYSEAYCWANDTTKELSGTIFLDPLPFYVSRQTYDPISN